MKIAFAITGKMLLFSGAAFAARKTPLRDYKGEGEVPGQDRVGLLISS